MRLLKISIIVIIGISLAIFGIFYTLQIEQNEQLSTEKEQELTVQKTMMEYYLRQCYGVPWTKDLSDDECKLYSTSSDQERAKIIMNYYEKISIQIFEIEFTSDNAQLCEACGCKDGTVYFVIRNSDMDKMLDLGFNISEKQIP